MAVDLGELGGGAMDGASDSGEEGRSTAEASGEEDDAMAENLGEGGGVENTGSTSSPTEKNKD